MNAVSRQVIDVPGASRETYDAVVEIQRCITDMEVNQYLRNPDWRLLSIGTRRWSEAKFAGGRDSWIQRQEPYYVVGRLAPEEGAS